MNTLKKKIKLLELKVMNDKKRLQQSQNAVCEEIQQLKKSVSVSQILLGGFVVGFLLGSRRKTALKLIRDYGFLANYFFMMPPTFLPGSVVPNKSDDTPFKSTLKTPSEN